MKDYTKTAISKLQTLGGSWTTDHELILNTILEERFAMANLVKQANLEIEKVRTISDKRAAALREKENQFLQTSKTLGDTHKALQDLFNNNATLASNSNLQSVYNSLNTYVTSGYSVKL